jgi:hypothetical protein
MSLLYLSRGFCASPLFGLAWDLRFAASMTWSACSIESSLPTCDEVFPWLLVAEFCSLVLFGMTVAAWSGAFCFWFTEGLEGARVLGDSASSSWLILGGGWLVHGWGQVMEMLVVMGLVPRGSGGLRVVVVSGLGSSIHGW